MFDSQKINNGQNLVRQRVVALTFSDFHCDCRMKIGGFLGEQPPEKCGLSVLLLSCLGQTELSYF